MFSGCLYIGPLSWYEEPEDFNSSMETQHHRHPKIRVSTATSSCTNSSIQAFHRNLFRVSLGGMLACCVFVDDVDVIGVKSRGVFRQRLLLPKLCFEPRTTPPDPTVRTRPSSTQALHRSTTALADVGDGRLAVVWALEGGGMEYGKQVVVIASQSVHCRNFSSMTQQGVGPV